MAAKDRAGTSLAFVGVIWGLLAALMWGSGDVVINRLTLVAGTTRSLIVTQVFSLICWLAAGMLSGIPAADPKLWGMAVLAGFFHVVGLSLTYRAFEIGTLSFVSPIASSFAIVTAVLAVVAGQKTPGIAMGGVALLVLGIIIVTRFSSNDSEVSLRGVPEALGSALAFGIMFFMLEEVTAKIDFAWPLAVLKTMALCSALLTYAITGRKSGRAAEPLPWKRIAVMGLVVALTDTAAWAAWIYGTRTSFVSVVTALASAFSAVTVILAAILLKERLSAPQYVGVGVLLSGIVLVSL